MKTKLYEDFASAVSRIKPGQAQVQDPTQKGVNTEGEFLKGGYAAIVQFVLSDNPTTNSRLVPVRLEWGTILPGSNAPLLVDFKVRDHWLNVDHETLNLPKQSGIIFGKVAFGWYFSGKYIYLLFVGVERSIVDEVRLQAAEDLDNLNKNDLEILYTGTDLKRGDVLTRMALHWHDVIK